MSQETQGDSGDGERGLRPTDFHEVPCLSILLEPDGTVRKVLQVSGVVGESFAELAAHNVAKNARLSLDGEASAAEWEERLHRLRTTMEPVRYLAAPPGSAPGQPESVRCVATPIPAADGTLDSILLQMEDRSTALRVQADLAESEERFRALAEALPQMVWVADPSSAVVYFSPQWEAFTGRDQEDLLGLGYMDLVHPEDRHLIHAQRDANGEFQAVTFRLLRHDGVYRWVEADYRVVYDDGGRIVRWVGGTTDVTDRLKAGAAARELQEQLRVALAVSGLGRYALYFRDEKITGDSKFAAILGIDVQETFRQSGLEGLFAMVHVDDVERVRQAVEAAAAGGPDYDVEYRMWRPTDDGSGATELRWVAASGRVEFDDDGPVRMVGVVGDITQRRAEEEARLRWQKREAIGTLAGGVAHDFNNVISAILSNASVAQTELQLGVRPSTSVSEIVRGAERAAEVVQRLMAFSREEQGEVEERVPFDVADVVKEACGLMTSTFPAGATLACTIAADLPEVLGSATDLHRVVVNLLSNAAYAIAGRPGTVTVDVDVITDPAAGDSTPSGEARPMVRIAVRDTGIGIAEAVLARIFDPFFTTKPAGKGTGLGLAAAQTIAQDHGGRIEAANIPGGGAQFTVLLPAHVPGTANAPTARSAQEPPTAEAPSEETEAVRGRVVFVDDEASLTRLAERALPIRGFEVRAFTDPTEALHAITADPAGVDALVTDLSMPQLTGLELIEQVRRLRPDLPTVLSSGFMTAANRVEAEHHGVDAILPKPCSVDDLVATLTGLLAPSPRSS